MLAASRGWVTPEMRVGLGVLVSLGLLAAAFDLDRRGWRADAILSAGGAGIAGLYATLWASISMYHFISEALGLPCAAAIAALAVALAIRVKQEPLAIFGIVAAMLAPTLVSHDVTGAGALFSFVIACAGLPLFWRYRWTWLLVSIWGTAILTLAPLYLTTHAGLSSAVLAGALFFCLFTVEATRLRAASPSSATGSPSTGWLLLGTSVSLSFAASFLYAGNREVLGRHLSGFVLLGVAGLYALLAVTPLLLRRRHADLTDLLAGFGLAALATATGLLLGGPGMVCGWAAESVVMIAVSERLLRRHGSRRLRLTVASGGYLLLAAFQTLLITAPTEVHLACRRCRLHRRLGGSGRSDPGRHRVLLRHPRLRRPRAALRVAAAGSCARLPARVGARRPVGGHRLRRAGGRSVRLPPSAVDGRDGWTTRSAC